MASFPNIPGYEIEQQLKSGGFGTTYLAIKRPIERRCVIKALKEDGNSETIKRFINEARVANAIKNPGIVQIYDYGTCDQMFYLVMEYIDKGSLWDRLMKSAEPPVTSTGIIAMMRQIASILRDVHAVGIYHRDLSPGNIMFLSDPLIDNGERVKIIDFGLAKVPVSIQPEQFAPVSTSMAAAFGTPGFMAPEAYVDVKNVSSACDVWALGAIIYYALTRRTIVIDWLSHAQPAPATEINTAVPQWLSVLISKMLAFRHEERPTMDQIIATITANSSRAIGDTATVDSRRDGNKVAQLRQLVGVDGTQIHARSYAANHGPAIADGMVTALDEQDYVVTIQGRYSGQVGPKVNIPIESVLCAWRHAKGHYCISINGLMLGNPYTDWLYFA